jgi:acetyl esterase/lipase
MPKQIEDIHLIIEKLKNTDYTLSDDYAMIGASAGAHLAMLYAYKFDTNHEVKAIADIVGPADFTDPQYLSHPLYSYASLNLIGTATPTIAQIQEVSPALYVNAHSAPTIMFYGGVDPLVPASQGPGLRDKLNAAGVTNEFNFYADGGHGDWSDATYIEVYAKLSNFLENNFN